LVDNRALRKRCLEQLQSAIEADKENLREELIAEVGCPAMTTQSAQLDWPLADGLRYPAKLIDDFEWERVLEGGGLFGDRNVRTVVKEPVGVVGAITPSNFPIEVILNKLGPGLAPAIPLCSNRTRTRPGTLRGWAGLSPSRPTSPRA
jgi:aldehyde dehydrogenase (NAD+)